MKPQPVATSTLAWCLGVLACGLALLGLAVGSNGFEILLSSDWSGNIPNAFLHNEIVMQIRAPRSLGSFLSGALLGLSGAIAQAFFRNPLAEPYLLGSSAGAALCFALGLVGIEGSPWTAGMLTQIGFTGLAFIGAWAAVLLTVLLARGGGNPLQLLLAGVIVGVVLAALLSLLSLRHPAILPTVQSFVLGNTGLLNWGACALLAGALLLCVVLGQVCARDLDAMALGVETAASLGRAGRGARWLVLATIALASAAAVAQTGLIAFVGLAAPHMVRSLVRARQATTMLLSAAMGGVLLLAADIGARWLTAPLELPVGIVTALLGGAYMLFLLRRLGV